MDRRGKDEQTELEGIFRAAKLFCTAEQYPHCNRGYMTLCMSGTIQRVNPDVRTWVNNNINTGLLILTNVH